jgi:hypothetical protein
LPRSESAAGGVADAPDVEDLASRRLAASDLWRALTRELPDRTERLVLYLTYVLDLRPRDIFAQYPDRFASVADIYRIKRSVVARLRGSRTIQRYVS